MDNQPKVFHVGNVLLHNTLMCTVTQIERTPMGFHRYHIRYVESGHINVVPKHELRTIEGFDNDDMPEMQWDTPILEVNPCTEVNPGVKPCTDVNPTASTSCKRFVTLTEEQLDGVAQERISRNTENQTKWAIKLFRGK